ncbi:unnamed protein product [Withania somnifera]
MAETPSVSAPTHYWCYQCEARVAVETLPDLPDVICNNCESGFVESIPVSQIDDPPLGNQLRLTTTPLLPPSEHADPSDDDDEDHNEIQVTNGDNRGNLSQSEDEDDDGGNEDVVDDEEDLRRRRRLPLRLRDFPVRASNRRNRILDWAEILMGLEDHSIELRLQVPDVDGYIETPGDYVDAAGYEALLQTLAESDGNGRRGAPPASKSAIEGLDSLVIKEEQEIVACAICKDVVNVSETAKNLPCGHGYHDDCILKWLGSRNSCPVCRFELPTDDPEYEEERKKRRARVTSSASSSSAGAAAEY